MQQSPKPSKCSNFHITCACSKSIDNCPAVAKVTLLVDTLSSKATYEGQEGDKYLLLNFKNGVYLKTIEKRLAPLRECTFNIKEVRSMRHQPKIEYEIPEILMPRKKVKTSCINFTEEDKKEQEERFSKIEEGVKTCGEAQNSFQEETKESLDTIKTQQKKIQNDLRNHDLGFLDILKRLEDEKILTARKTNEERNLRGEVISLKSAIDKIKDDVKTHDRRHRDHDKRMKIVEDRLASLEASKHTETKVPSKYTNPLKRLGVDGSTRGPTTSDKVPVASADESLIKKLFVSRQDDLNKKASRGAR